MKCLYFLPALLLLASNSLAQTKLISHKSHGGSDADFAAALSQNSYFSSNFGEPTLYGSSVQLDSLIFVNGKAMYFVVSGISNENGGLFDEMKWQEGRNFTNITPKIFDNLESIEQVRAELERHYDFRNSMGEVKIVGFIPNSKLRNENEIIPIWRLPKDFEKGISKSPFSFLVFLAGISLLLAAAWKKIAPKSNHKVDLI